MPDQSLRLLLASLALLAACSSYPRRDPTNERFPTVRGTALDGTEVTLPDAFAGGPVLLLVGYEQNTQFDLDRWTMGLTQMGIKVRALELPTIPGMMPGLFSGYIDSGMRRGIPKEDWGGVVTLYKDASLVTRFTGTQDALPGRILLLDKNGMVVFFHDRGFSLGSLQKLQEVLQKLK
ncbi:hypothetical protein LBMAG49_31600 [Planctomycetota bacterium]|nr:hypothetical protein LBMAG49_31600 [Planctomycetota bacterium]